MGSIPLGEMAEMVAAMRAERDAARAEAERYADALRACESTLATKFGEPRPHTVAGELLATIRVALASSTAPEGGTPPAGEPCSLCEGTGIEPTFVEQDCPRCKGRGCEYGYGEDGHDPDWCGGCGGSGVVMVRAPSPSPSHPRDENTTKENA